MKILILGGTKFLGPHLIEAALGRGHEISTFTRGRQMSKPLPEVEMLFGDRNADLDVLDGRTWDAVIDTCGYTPRSVERSGDFFSTRAALYVFVSSICVYKDVSVFGIDESAPVAELTPEQLRQSEAIDTSGAVSAVSYGESYGGLKALSERSAEERMPGRVLVVRPGLIVGPGDNTDRFSYWIARVARGGEVLAPGRPERRLQFIDVQDLAEWIISMIERKQTGVFNANGPPDAFSMKELLEQAKAESGSDASFTWVTDEFLMESGVAPWSEVPLWVPEEEEQQGFMFIDSSKAVAHGLHYRPLQETVRAVLEAVADRNISDFNAGLDPIKEASILRDWHERKGSKEN